MAVRPNEASGLEAATGLPLNAVRANRFVDVNIKGADVEAAGDLNWAHADLFDRLIIAQARSRSMTLVTADRAIQRFIGVAIIAAE